MTADDVRSEYQRCFQELEEASQVCLLLLHLTTTRLERTSNGASKKSINSLRLSLEIQKEHVTLVSLAWLLKMA
jgi:hypothetical protein